MNNYLKSFSLPLQTYADYYNREYFENGVLTGVSGYHNYGWMPEITIPFVKKIVKYMQIYRGDVVLDYGCAKGYIPLALRYLGVNAYGCDISEYAINNAHPDIMQYLSLINEQASLPYTDNEFMHTVAKDVFEHIPEALLDSTLRELLRISRKLFVIVPLGDGVKYIIPSYENDITHIHRQPIRWWMDKFIHIGWKVCSFCDRIPGMKDTYSDHPNGNGFILLSRTY